MRLCCGGGEEFGQGCGLSHCLQAVLLSCLCFLLVAVPPIVFEIIRQPPFSQLNFKENLQNPVVD